MASVRVLFQMATALVAMTGAAPQIFGEFLSVLQIYHVRPV
jgi:hypothetical protein